MEKNYIAKLLKTLAKDKAFLSKKQEKFSIGLSETDIKKIKKYCVEENLIEQKEKEFIVTEKGLNLIENYKDKFDYLNIESLKLEKAPTTLTKAIRELSRYYLENEELKENSLQTTLLGELKKINKKEFEEFLLNKDIVNFEDFFNYFLEQGFTKSIISLVLLEFLSKNKEKFAFYERGQFELDFNSLMFERIVANPKNFIIKKAILVSSFLNDKINILDETKKLILKFKTLEKITLQTNNLTPKTLKFKNIVLNSKDPMQLFQKDLKNIFENKEDFKNSINELENFYNKIIKELEEYLFNEFRIKSLDELKTRFNKIKEYINNKELLILGNNLNSIERLATLLIKKEYQKIGTI